MLRDFFLGIIKIHILFHASQAPVYGTELMEELGRHGYTVSPGTLYPILHGLEKEDLVSSYRKNENGKLRRYYQITKKGLTSLEQARIKVRELVHEIINDAS